MDKLIFEGVRCFHSLQTVPLKRITLLVGENSTGKSTFLALARIAWQICQGNALIDFNEEPFQLGTYDQIATFRGGRAGHSRYFVIGSQIPLRVKPKKNLPNTLPDTMMVTGCFVNDKAQPKLKDWVLDAGSYRVAINYGEQDRQPQISIKTPSSSLIITDENYVRFATNFPDFFAFLAFSFGSKLPMKWERAEGSLSESDQEFLKQLGFSLMEEREPRPYAFAPIRTHPKRTYDPLADVPKPEGSHVPMILAKTSLSDPDAWSQLRQALDSFGKQSGLFTDVGIQRMGSKDSAPFQIKVKISGPAFNLVDVGYGVSQVLPIVVDSLQRRKGSIFLLQQPEVHLHPKAQAELGSFLAVLAKTQDKCFLIETHSDYLVDRVRTEVRNHKYLSTEDVLILYFERENGGVNIHPLELDHFGNIVNAPPGYRDFFLEEEMKLLGG